MLRYPRGRDGWGGASHPGGGRDARPDLPIRFAGGKRGDDASSNRPPGEEDEEEMGKVAEFSTPMRRIDGGWARLRTVCASSQPSRLAERAAPQQRASVSSLVDSVIRWRVAKAKGVSAAASDARSGRDISGLLASGGASGQCMNLWEQHRF
uniref:Uncharacterized protein n=1 Tax=Oryza nivara TaxID=4536 RepID=A0A0E0H2W8_ORYNI